MDIFLVFFVLATFLAALRAENSRQVIWASVLLGLAIAVKWAAFPVAVPVGYVLWRKGLLRPFLGGLWFSAIIYVAVVYVGALLTITTNPIGAWVWTWDWHVKAAHKITAHGRSGLNVWIPVREETATVQALAERGWGVAAGERFRLRSASAVRVTTSALVPDDARRFAADFAAALRSRAAAPA